MRLIAENLHLVTAAEGGEFFINVSAQSVHRIDLTLNILRILAHVELSLDVDIIL